MTKQDDLKEYDKIIKNVEFLRDLLTVLEKHNVGIRHDHDSYAQLCWYSEADLGDDMGSFYQHDIDVDNVKFQLKSWENMLMKCKVVQTTVVPRNVRKDIIAHQLVEIEYCYGRYTEVFDTNIMVDGKQYVINGNGFIKSGTEISQYTTSNQYDSFKSVTEK